MESVYIVRHKTEDEGELIVNDEIFKSPQGAADYAFSLAIGLLGIKKESREDIRLMSHIRTLIFDDINAPYRSFTLPCNWAEVDGEEVRLEDDLIEIQKAKVNS